MLVTKQFTVAIHVHIFVFYNVEVNSYRQLFGYQQEKIIQIFIIGLTIIVNWI